MKNKVTTQQQYIPAKYLLTLLNMMSNDQAVQATYCQQIQFNYAVLARNKEQLIDANYYTKLYKLYITNVSDENFGFASNMGESFSRYKMLFMLMLSCDTLGGALNKVQEFYDTFIQKSKKNINFFFPAEENKFLFNLRKYVNSKFEKLEVNHIENINFDTFSENEKFFSFRKSNQAGHKDYGRCISVISLVND